MFSTSKVALGICQKRALNFPNSWKFPVHISQSLQLFGKWTWRIDQGGISECVLKFDTYGGVSFGVQGACASQCNLSHTRAKLLSSLLLVMMLNSSSVHTLLCWVFNNPSWMIDYDNLFSMFWVLVVIAKLTCHLLWALHLKCWASWVVARHLIQVAWA